MEDIRFSALHSVNIDTLPNRLARFVVRAFDSKTYNFYLKTGVVHVSAEKLWLSQFALKKKNRIFATDIAEKLVRSTRVDFMFKVNFLMLFGNVMGKTDMMRAFVNISVVRRIREDTNIAGVEWCDFIHHCLVISHEPNTVSGSYNGPLCFLIYLEIEDEAFGKLKIYGEWSENETVKAKGFCENASVLPHTDKKIICEMIEEKLSSISKEKAEVETLLRDANNEFSNDDNVKQLFEQYKGFFKETILLEEAKAQKAPQNVKPKPAAMKIKEAAEKPKSAENVKELAEKPNETAEKAQKAPQNVKPKPAVKTNEAAKKPMPAKNVKEWLKSQRSQLVMIISKEYVKPVKTVNTPYMCRRINGTAHCKRIEFVLGNSLFAMEGDKYLKKQNHSSHEAVAKMRPFIPKLKWRTSNNHVDCGVFAMIHMENYVGDAAKNWEFGLCEESDERLSMLQHMRYKIDTKIMLHQFNVVSKKMFDFAFTFETKYTEQARVSMIVDAIKNRNNRDPPKQVKETDAANVVVGVNEVVDQVKEK
uniref:Peptidase C48, SUMO/sentrin/Ubl1 n=1 Tax=Tanacetum cinerariifolium TaxID=118510 RepID=A0A699ITN8_TANCI|nr:peptidase C48, SUMO/sentrin/Ubl1 [Tanacetum cinerariifolium]